MASIPDPKRQFKEFQQSFFKALVSATAASNAIPVNDVGYLRSLDRQFAKDLDTCGSRLLKTSNQLLQHCSADTGVEASTYEDVDDVNERYGGVVDVVDGLLEKADVCLDEMLGRTGKGNDQIKQQAAEVAQVSKGKLEYKLLHASNIVRPQMKFKDAVDNSNSTPFIRKIKHKPHAQVPLEYGVTPDMVEGIEGGKLTHSLPHPYEYEIQHIKYPDFMFQAKERIMYEPFDTTTAAWVDDDASLEKMMDELAKAHEIAIDLEHHNYRSYQGFTCLMQISTREHDFIVDTLQLRDRLWQLNEYFADPNVVKVLHGADSDIIWLQRDFGLYIVNLFDTYFASQLLEFPQKSLAYLLRTYCNVEADKKYQLADWRIRPLPEEMLKYARADTHYLLYIYDCVRNELIERSAANDNLLRAALQRSAGVAAQKHEKEVYDLETGEGPNGWKGLLRKWQHPMTTQQMAVFKALHQWRDVTAREQDESVRFVLPNHMLFSLVERMPSDSAGVMGCCNPCPPLVRMNAQSIGILIQKTRMDAVLPSSAQSSAATQQQPIKTETLTEKKPATSITSIPIKKIKVAKMEVDPSAFDLSKVDHLRREHAEMVGKAVSSLFGEAMDDAIDDALNESTRALVDEIRSNLRLTLPFEGLKFKQKVKEEPLSSPSAATAQAEQSSSNQQQPAELLYVAPEKRETKKRKAVEASSSTTTTTQQEHAVQEEQDAIVLKDTMRKTKKKKGSKKKKSKTPPQE
ncbi:ribonuclease H-like domain-containing protein [Zychaea mexicana]|uniref:ribonuclease H-like domain-containing protein n=1 Tax=Zychaea mexicana TaxID=64656 RepID=UPI0022FF2B9F|nr:ribonuclease H-like domain-containing protein [Zychaea mexicana]KAI9496799.1 ribonuclease H-like domain-containing protein [Zychaea mexicana]